MQKGDTISILINRLHGKQNKKILLITLNDLIPRQLCVNYLLRHIISDRSTPRRFRSALGPSLRLSCKRMARQFPRE